MYKAIIVDDELLIRVAYQSIVDWDSYGFEVVGMFENGQEALDAFDEIQPDFVLTDTKMPLCNGIDLIRQIKKRSPDTICIILSAYGDLDYVKEGMRAGAEDYMLKLDITPERMGEVLKSVAEMLQDVKQSKVENVSAERQKERDEFLRKWIRGEFKEPDTISDYLDFYKIRLRTDKLNCLSIWGAGGSAISGKTMMVTVRQTVEQVLKSSGTWLLTDIGDDYLCAVGCGDHSASLQYVESVKKSIIFALKSVMNLQDVEIRWNTAKDLTDVPNVFRALAPNRTAEWPQDLGIQELIDGFWHRRYEEAIERLRKLSHIFSGAYSMSIATMKNICSYVLMGLQAVMKDDQLLNDCLKEECSAMQSELAKCFNSKDVVQWLEKLATKLDEMRRDRASAASLSERAADYIFQHFAEDLSLDTIAEHCGISSTYLSRIFAQEQGKGIQEYLTDLRMKRAKELLIETNEKIYEIAAKSGYPDAVYFNKVFKKNTGMTPKEYRVQEITRKTKNDKKNKKVFLGSYSLDNITDKKRQ